MRAAARHDACRYGRRGAGTRPESPLPDAHRLHGEVRPSRYIAVDLVGAAPGPPPGDRAGISSDLPAPLRQVCTAVAYHRVSSLLVVLTNHEDDETPAQRRGSQLHAPPRLTKSRYDQSYMGYTTPRAPFLFRILSGNREDLKDALYSSGERKVVLDRDLISGQLSGAIEEGSRISPLSWDSERQTYARTGEARYSWIVGIHEGEVFAFQMYSCPYLSGCKGFTPGCDLTADHIKCDEGLCRFVLPNGPLVWPKRHQLKRFRRWRLLSFHVRMYRIVSVFFRTQRPRIATATRQYADERKLAFRFRTQRG